MDPLDIPAEDILQKNNFFKRKVIFYVAGFLGFLFLFNFLFLSAPKDFPVDKITNISQGVGLRVVSKNLKDNNIIRSRVAFEFFVIMYGGEKHISSGDYLFERRLSVFEVASRIVKGEYHLAPLKVTIPEGFNIQQIADTFSLKLKNFNKNNFLEDAKSFEGYLFPDTYFFTNTANENDVLEYMAKNFDRRTASLDSDFKKSNRSKEDIITMASIIEREAKGDEDRAIISGILWNRIAKKMPLQVDAAPDTYKKRGLPANPICNPGLEAIKAAIHPTVSNYLYYLHDSSGTIHYARTFEEHKLNKAKYLK
jgi:UPF0755 protein